MPGFLLHENATVLCSHPPGQAKPTVANPRVKVSGQKIVTQASIYSITGCVLPPQSGGPCATAKWTSAAERVKAGGVAVLLTTSEATCVPTLTGLNIGLTQRRVKGT
ncbi:hypothetical protein KJ068_11785 [bacterium]|nr:hypothetical protein [bacterium]